MASLLTLKENTEEQEPIPVIAAEFVVFCATGRSFVQRIPTKYVCPCVRSDVKTTVCAYKGVEEVGTEKKE